MFHAITAAPDDHPIQGPAVQPGDLEAYRQAQAAAHAEVIAFMADAEKRKLAQAQITILFDAAATISEFGVSQAVYDKSQEQRDVKQQKNDAPACDLHVIPLRSRTEDLVRVMQSNKLVTKDVLHGYKLKELAMNPRHSLTKKVNSFKTNYTRQKKVDKQKVLLEAQEDGEETTKPKSKKRMSSAVEEDAVEAETEDTQDMYSDEGADSGCEMAPPPLAKKTRMSSMCSGELEDGGARQAE
ncbi:hypothetical protein LTR09_005323 [Extremus antarcticus]|uniref:Uncharacterized protein n=1 Tax=Extremus antarcticus TaxID=702011 RepID=A0AAJ0DGD6_9PEZI|nr:hypothetical protein LTR09_005323 [Extremus antarcticus]